MFVQTTDIACKCQTNNRFDFFETLFFYIKCIRLEIVENYQFGSDKYFPGNKHIAADDIECHVRGFALDGDVCGHHLRRPRLIPKGLYRVLCEAKPRTISDIGPRMKWCTQKMCTSQRIITPRQVIIAITTLRHYCYNQPLQYIGL